MSELAEAPTLGDAAQEFIRELDVVMRDDGTDEPSLATKRLGGTGQVDVGVLAVVVDLVAGHFILRQGWPCGISTTEMSLNGMHRLQGPGLLVSTVRLVSITRTRGCVELDLWMEGSDLGTATATAAFKLFRQDDAPADLGVPSPWIIGEATTSLDEPLWQRAGIEMDGAAGSARVELTPEITNHVSSLQGGVTAALLEAAARTQLDPGSEIRSMVMTFLSQGRRGPYRATARRTGPDADVVVTSAVDLGNDDRPLAHAVFTTVTPRRAP